MLDQVKLVYANGDSFTFAQGIDGVETSAKNIYDYNDFKKFHGYTGVIARELNAWHKNNSLPGGSNDRMIRTTIQDLIELEKHYKPEETLVLLGWTAAERTEFHYEPNDSYFPFLINCPPDVSIPKKMYEIFTAYFNSDKAQITRYFTQILMMQGYLKSKGYQYLFTESILTLISQMKPILEMTGNDSYKEQIDMSRFVQPSFSTFNAHGNYGITACYHPSKEGHAAWANHLLEHLKCLEN